MEDRIFFKDKTLTLRGPFTEREVQEWYREGWFDSAFPFYFTRGGETPSESNGITLDSLRSLNGIGCPFAKVDENVKRELEKKRRDREEKLERIEKEIADLHRQCDAILCLEKTIEKVERQLQELSTSSRIGKSSQPADSANLMMEKGAESVEEVAVVAESKKKKKKNTKTDKNEQKLSKPDSITDNIWQKFYELGNTVSDFVLEVIDVYGTGKFASWDRNQEIKGKNIEIALKKEKGAARKGLNLVCEHILVEKMKEKEFFCCELCIMTFFNYKQALIHFVTLRHKAQENASGVSGVQRLLDWFTDLPRDLAEIDQNAQANNISKYGVLPNGAPRDSVFLSKLMSDNSQLIVTDIPGFPRFSQLDATDIVLSNVKGEPGQKLLAELGALIGKNPTQCIYCHINTGDREEFYAHLLNFTHIQNVDKNLERVSYPVRFCLFTLLVNVHRKDLI